MGGAAVTSVPESVVAAKVVRNDGRTPFLRPQKGVAPVDGDDFVTRAWAIANLGGGGSGSGSGSGGGGLQWAGAWESAPAAGVFVSSFRGGWE